MFEKTLIATDLSPASGQMMSCASELKAVGLKQVVLAHVIYVANTPGLEEGMKAAAAPVLMEQKNALEEQGLKVETEMPFGIPARVLNELAERHDVNAILVSSRGRGIMQRAVLGSVAFKLLQMTHKPVLLNRVSVRDEAGTCRFSVCQRLFEHLLFPTDFSETAEHAFYHLEGLAADLKGPVTLLHVQDLAHREHLSDLQAQEQTELDGERLDALKDRLEKKGVLVETDLVEGNPREEVLQRAASGRYSLIAMGTQGKGFFGETLLGSLAHEVASRAELPTLFFPSHQ